MMRVPLTVRFFVATGTAAALVACSSGGDGSSAPKASDPTPTAASTPTEDTGKQAYLDAVNALCDDLLPKVIKATHGGSTDVPAAEWVRTWPAHKKALDEFDAALAQVQVPSSAADAARVMGDYVVWATGIDDTRIAAAQQGEEAWQAELEAEADIENDPTLLALGPAGFADSCQAR